MPCKTDAVDGFVAMFLTVRRVLSYTVNVLL